MKKFFLSILLVVMMLSLRGLALADKPAAITSMSYERGADVGNAAPLHMLR